MVFSKSHSVITLSPDFWTRSFHISRRTYQAIHHKSSTESNLDFCFCRFKIATNLGFDKCNRDSSSGVVTFLRFLRPTNRVSSPQYADWLWGSPNPLPNGCRGSCPRGQMVRACSWPHTSMSSSLGATTLREPWPPVLFAPTGLYPELSFSILQIPSLVGPLERHLAI